MVTAQMLTEHWSAEHFRAESFSTVLQESFGVDPLRIPIIIASACIMYLLLFCSFRLFGARMLSGNTLFDTVIFLMVGAVAGRAVLGHPPTLGAGIIGVVTFLAIELTFGKMRKYRAARKSPHTTARLIFAHGAPLPLQMKQARVSSHDIITAARTSGATSLAEIQCMILEENGKISVFSEERPISSELLADVKDRELL